MASTTRAMCLTKIACTAGLNWSGRAAAVPQQWRVERLCWPALVQRRRTACLRCPLGAGRLDETLGVGDLPAEVTRVKRLAPDRFVHGTQIADGERITAESRGECGVLKPRPCAFYRVVQDLRMVKRQVRLHLADRFPARAACVRASRGDGKVGGDREKGHADHASSRITVRRAVGRELLQVQGPSVHAGLLG